MSIRRNVCSLFECVVCTRSHGMLAIKYRTVTPISRLWHHRVRLIIYRQGSVMWQTSIISLRNVRTRKGFLLHATVAVDVQTLFRPLFTCCIYFFFNGLRNTTIYKSFFFFYYKPFTIRIGNTDRLIVTGNLFGNYNANTNPLKISERVARLYFIIIIVIIIIIFLEGSST